MLHPDGAEPPLESEVRTKVAPMKRRSQFKTANGHYAKRNRNNGQIMNVKADHKPFKRVSREK
jgi:hypothetical protein